MSARRNDLHFKDEVLDQLAMKGNVAQFVSFGPKTIEERFSRVAGYAPNHKFGGARQAVSVLVERSPEQSVNVRSFEPGQPKSRTFLYGVRSTDDVVSHLSSLAQQGMYSIVNETIDVNDGGVSGVCFGGVAEFAPGETPRCVEGPDTAELPVDWALRVFSIVYGIDADIPVEDGVRIEFSIHPLRRGYRVGHTVLWERERIGLLPIKTELRWPNKFSRHIGDKAFGLLIAHLAGLPVPRTLVVSRLVPPFAFGAPTGTGETWVRTCPREQVPGKYTTKRGWLDPFVLMQTEDPDARVLASLLAQDGVLSEYSGALVATSDGGVEIEGIAGSGEGFMQGSVPPQQLPPAVRSRVMATFKEAQNVLGPVRMEWVYDGARVWIVQLHVGATQSSGRVIFPGSPPEWRRIRVADGLEGLRAAIAHVRDTPTGVILEGNVGITSHMADLLRHARIPSRIERAGTGQ